MVVRHRLSSEGSLLIHFIAEYHGKYFKCHFESQYLPQKGDSGSPVFVSVSDGPMRTKIELVGMLMSGRDLDGVIDEKKFERGIGHLIPHEEIYWDADARDHDLVSW